MTKDTSEDTRPSKDLTWLILAVTKKFGTLVIDASPGYWDTDMLMEAPSAEDCGICWPVGKLPPIGLYLVDGHVSSGCNQHTGEWDGGINVEIKTILWQEVE